MVTPRKGERAPESGTMQKLYSNVATFYFLVATVTLMVLAFLILIAAIWEAVSYVMVGNLVDGAISGVALLIIGFAVIETAKFIAEEEILRERELRSSTESRRSITKFITIIVIAASLEALVMIFQVSRRGIEYALYPAGLFVAAMFALVALGIYQYLSSRIISESPLDKSGPEEKEPSGPQPSRKPSK